MKRLLTVLLAMVFALQLSAQTDPDKKPTPSDDDPTTTVKKKKKTRFKKNNYGFVFDLGFNVGSSENSGADIVYGASHSITLGSKYIRQMHSVFGLGGGLSYKYEAFYLDQNASKLVPNNVQHDKEVMRFHNLSIDLITRYIILRKLSKKILYVEAGAYGDFAAFSQKHVTFDSQKIGNKFAQSDEQKTIYSDLNYYNKFNYGVKVLVGYRWYALSVSYRLSDYFNQDFKDNVCKGEFPRLTIGLAFNVN